MNQTFRLALVVPALLIAAFGQTSPDRGKSEFDAASIRVNPPRAGFHFASDASTGGPGSSDPGMFRCSNCTLAALIGKAFALENYQFPGRSALTSNTFDVMARIPAGATQAEFQAMLQNLLKDRFGLSYHYSQKSMRGYNLVTAGKGSKLKESADNERAAATGPKAGQHGYGQGQAHEHSGPMVFDGAGVYRRSHQTTAELARMLSDQLGVPVDDQTGLQGNYDIALTWATDGTRSSDHADGAWSGGSHAGHGGGPAAGSGAAPSEVSAPNLFEALQSQLGLKLVASSQTTARIFVVDRVQPLPTEN